MFPRNSYRYSSGGRKMREMPTHAVQIYLENLPVGVCCSYLYWYIAGCLSGFAIFPGSLVFAQLRSYYVEYSREVTVVAVTLLHHYIIVVETAPSRPLPVSCVAWSVLPKTFPIFVVASDYLIAAVVHLLRYRSPWD